MSFEVKIPAVGESIASGTVAQWHKRSGDYVKRGDILLTLETDKISTELEAEKAGILEIKVEEGEEVPIGEVVAIIEAGESAGSAEEGSAEARGTGDTESESSGTEASAEASAPVAVDAESVSREKQEPTGGASGSGAVGAASPELRVVEGPEEAKPSPVAPGESEGGGEGGEAAENDSRATRRKMSPLRKKIATHLVSAQQTAAILSTFNECDMTAVMALRKTLQDVFVERYGVKLGFMSFFVKAVVSALREVPAINARIDGEHIVSNNYFDIGVAVSTEKGLIVPVIRDCERKSFAEIEKEILGAATKARDGKLTLEDLQGGVFTISNGGIYGSLLSTPIVNPPQSGILGMHTIQQRPVAVDGEVAIRPMMYLALSYDHRLIDGREAVRFLIRVKECIEAPERLLVEA